MRNIDEVMSKYLINERAQMAKIKKGDSVLVAAYTDYRGTSDRPNHFTYRLCTVTEVKDKIVKVENWNDFGFQKSDFADIRFQFKPSKDVFEATGSLFKGTVLFNHKLEQAEVSKIQVFLNQLEKLDDKLGQAQRKENQLWASSKNDADNKPAKDVAKQEINAIRAEIELCNRKMQNVCSSFSWVTV
jgi:hypothetical protein